VGSNWTKQAVDAFNSQLAKLDNRFEQPEHKRASPPAEIR
jgi:hypothetical protein